MLYSFLKIFSRLAMMIWGRRILINKPGCLKEKGPLLLASNHPNSFLDSIILDTLFEQPVWSLARGDVFKNPFYARLLASLKILPVYRTSEGVENLSENYKTFEDCITIFKKKGIVTIFSEGKCVNEWHLRPLKKGTARLSIKAWEEDIPLKVLPVGINYSSFHRAGKNIFLNFGNIIQEQDIDLEQADGLRHQSFNNRLQAELTQLVMEIPASADKEVLKINVPFYKKIILFIPAAIGFLLHAPLYLPIKSFTWQRTHDNDHYDSVITGLLILLYPFYLLVLTVIAGLLLHSWWVLSILLLLPFSAWSYIQLKSQLDR